MITVIIFLLVSLLTFAFAFAVTFTAVSLLVAWKRRDIPKYCYSQPAEPIPPKHDTSFNSEEPTIGSADGSSAVSAWQIRAKN